MTCLACGAQNPDTNRYCLQCGALLQRPVASSRPAAASVLTILHLLSGVGFLLLLLTFGMVLLVAMFAPAEMAIDADTSPAMMIVGAGFLSLIFAALTIVSLVMAWATWQGKNLAYYLNLLIAVLWCLTIIGLLISAPVIVLLLQPEAKAYFGLGAPAPAPRLP